MSKVYLPRSFNLAIVLITDNPAYVLKMNIHNEVKTLQPRSHEYILLATETDAAMVLSSCHHVFDLGGSQYKVKLTHCLVGTKDYNILLI